MANVLTGGRLINIGTVENPIMIPEAVIARDGSDRDREMEWWNALASGSVTLPDEVLNKLLSPESTDAKKGK